MEKSPSTNHRKPNKNVISRIDSGIILKCSSIEKQAFELRDDANYDIFAKMQKVAGSIRGPSHFVAMVQGNIFRVKMGRFFEQIKN